MRYMWESKLDKGIITLILGGQNIEHVIRHMYLMGERKEMVITSQYGMSYAISSGIAVEDTWWTITSCNKQYTKQYWKGVSRYLGCMKQVDLETAIAHTKGSDTRWYMLNYEDQIRWIVIEGENPNRIISKDEPPKSSSIESLKVITRPWPLQSSDYDTWKQDILYKVNAVLEDAI